MKPTSSEAADMSTANTDAGASRAGYTQIRFVLDQDVGVITLDLSLIHI